jgi:hypothetical protein
MEFIRGQQRVDRDLAAKFLNGIATDKMGILRRRGKCAAAGHGRRRFRKIEPK